MKYITAVLFGLFLLGGIALTAKAADVDVDINVAVPPLEFAGPPDLVVVPSGQAYVYMVPNVVGVYFYNGYWYRFYDDYWYRSSVYNGAWVAIDDDIVPPVIVSVPPEYPRYLPGSYYRIHYADFNRHWRNWETERHWNRYGWYKNELRADVRRDRERSIERGLLHERPRRFEERRGREEYRAGRALDRMGSRQAAVGRRQETVGTRDFNQGLANQNRIHQLENRGRPGEGKSMMREGRVEERRGARDMRQGANNVEHGMQKQAVGHNEKRQGAQNMKQGSKDEFMGHLK